MISKLQINENSSIKEALKAIDVNGQQVLFVTNSSGGVIGVVTDGDIRRGLLLNLTLDDPVIRLSNSDFVWTLEDESRESILKKLDERVQIIPILGSDRRLVGVVSRNNLPAVREKNVVIMSRAPVRVSFGGGGSDLSNYFLSNVGAVINVTISLYAHVTMTLRDDNEIHIESKDLGETVCIKDVNDLQSYVNSKFGLIISVLMVIDPKFGFNLHIYSDFPLGSGLGGSATVAVAILGCFNELRRDKWTQYEVAELAYQAERHVLGISGGWQDQYASVFGGFNFMEFKNHQNLVHPLRLPRKTQLLLEESLVLCDTGILHNSDLIHKDQSKSLKDEDKLSFIGKNVDLTYELRDSLLKGRLDSFGEFLNMAWNYKKKFSTKISNNMIDQIYDFAIQNGATGGKLLGAGGGGFFLFYVQPLRKIKLVDLLAKHNLKIRNFNFDSNGLESWTVRNSIDE